MWDEWLANSKLVRPPGGALWMSRELLTAQPWCARFLYNVHCNVLQFRGLFSHLNTIHFFFHLPETESLKEISIIRAIHLFCILFCCHRQNMEKLYSLNPPQKNSFVLWYIYLLFFSKYGSIYSFNPTSKILNMEYFVYHDGRHLLITLNGCEVEWVSSASPIHMINTSYNTVLSN